MRLPHATILSPEAAQEILDEMNRPPADTPERRATFQRARELAAHWKQLGISDKEISSWGFSSPRLRPGS